MSVFSDQRVIDFIGENFIPVTTDINRSMYQKDAVGDYFRKIAEQGHYAGKTKPTPTRQGLYVALPDGQLLASVNSTDADRVLKMMRAGLEKRKSLNATTKTKIDQQFKPDSDYTTPFPAGGTILRVTCRDLPREKDPKHETWRHNFDYAWLTAAEVKSLAPPNPNSAKVGQQYSVDSAILSRIAKYHLIDHVKGEAPHWKSDSVKVANADAEVVSIKGDEVEIKLEGRLKVVEQGTGEINPYTGKPNSESGLELKLSGRMTWNLTEEAFTSLQWIAYGDRWGTATYNFRHKDKEKNPIGFSLELLPTTPENMTQPKYLHRNYFKN